MKQHNGKMANLCNCAQKCIINHSLLIHKEKVGMWTFYSLLTNTSTFTSGPLGPDASALVHIN